MRLLLGLGLGLLVPSLALAQPAATATATTADIALAPPGATPLAPPGAAALGPLDRAPDPAPTGPVGLDRRLAIDAAAGRAYFSDTALTNRQGAATLSLRAPTAPFGELQLRYAFTDWLELGAGGTVFGLDAIGEEYREPHGMLGLHAKARLWRNDRAAIAVAVSRYDLDEADDDGATFTIGDGTSFTIPSVVASTCLDGPDCLVLVSASLTAVVIGDQDDVPVLGGLGWAFGRRFQFVGEVHYSDDDGDAITLGYLGLRANGRALAFDFGVAFAAEIRDCDTCDGESGAFPFFALATRL